MYVQQNFLESVIRLRDFVNDLDNCNHKLLAAGGVRPTGSQYGAQVGPKGRGSVSDSIMGLAKKYEFEYRVPFKELDKWERWRAPIGKPVTMESAAGDPNLEHLFHPQLYGSDYQPTMVREVRGCIETRFTFAMALACAFVEFSASATASDIHDAYMAWPIVHAKKTRQIAGARSTASSRWRHPRHQYNTWGIKSSWGLTKEWSNVYHDPDPASVVVPPPPSALGGSGNESDDAAANRDAVSPTSSHSTQDDRRRTRNFNSWSSTSSS